jgi:hypothetical protein
MVKFTIFSDILSVSSKRLDWIRSAWKHAVELSDSFRPEQRGIVQSTKKFSYKNNREFYISFQKLLNSLSNILLLSLTHTLTRHLTPDNKGFVKAAHNREKREGNKRKSSNYSSFLPFLRQKAAEFN